jgi:hypothetical protein
VRYAGVEQNAFGGRGLARVDMRADPDITVTFDGCFTCHSDKPLNS